MKKCVFFLLMHISVCCLSQTPYANTPQVDGDVHCFQRNGDTIFIGGGFSHLYYPDSVVANIARVDTVKGRIIPGFPLFNGSVYTAIEDSSGGIYVFGNFTRAGDSARYGIAHLDSNNRVTERCRTAKIHGSNIRAFLFRNNTIYLRGVIEGVGSSVKKSSSAIIDAATGEPILSSPYFNGVVWDAIPDGRGGWFVGGEFTRIGDSLRTGLARIDSNGSVYAWSPVLNEKVTDLHMAAGKLVILGEFTKVGGIAKKQVAIIDTATGVPYPWNLDPFVGFVTGLASVQDTLYISGSFTGLGGISRSKLAAFNLSTGTMLPFAPTIGSGDVNTVAIAPGKLIIGGTFTSVNGNSRSKLASFNLSSGILNSTPVGVSASYSSVMKLVCDSNIIYVGTQPVSTAPLVIAYDASSGITIPTFNAPSGSGSVERMIITQQGLLLNGSFTNVGLYFRSSFVALHPASGTMLPFRIGSHQTNVTAAGNGRLFVGGRGSYIGGQGRSYLAALDAITGEPVAWDPDANTDVYATCLYKDSLFIGGTFSAVKGVAQTRISRCDLVTGNITTPTVSIIGTTVSVMALKTKGDTLLIGGMFTQISNGTLYSRMSLAAVNLTNSAVLPFNLTVSKGAAGLVTAIEVVGDKVYIGGDFSNVFLSARKNLAKVSLAGFGSVLPWDPGRVCSVQQLVYRAGKMYVSSNACFSDNDLMHFAAHDTVLGELSQWDPAAGYVFSRSDFCVGASSVIVYGDFKIVGIKPYRCLAAYNFRTNRIIDIPTGIDNNWAYINTMQLHNGKLYIGGQFHKVNRLTRNNIAQLDVATGTLTGWNPGANSSVERLRTDGVKLYAVGQFDTIAGSPRKRAGALLLNGMIQAWNPTPDTYINTFDMSSGQTYLFGNFNTIRATPRSHLAKTDTVLGNIIAAFGGTTTGFAPSPWDIDVTGGNIYVSGSFGNLLSYTRTNIAELDQITGVPTSWDPAPNQTVTAFIPTAQRYYICSKATLVSSMATHRNLHPMEQSSKALLPWAPEPNEEVMDILDADTVVILGGAFDSIGNIPRRGLAIVPFKIRFSVDSVRAPRYCPGDSLKAYFSVGAPFLQNNTLQLQLSDTAGNFALQRVIGTFQDSVIAKKGFIWGRIPGKMIAGAYRVRIVCNVPNLVSDSVITTFTILPQPPTAVGLDAINACFTGNVFRFRDSTTGVVTGRSWLLSDGFTRMDSTFTHGFDSVKSYTARLINVNNYGCTDTAFRSITVFPMPKAMLYISDTAVCKKFAWTGIDSSTIISGTLHSIWLINDSIRSLSKIFNNYFTDSGLMRVMLRSVSAAGCADSIGHEVYVRPLPATNFSAQSDTQCAAGNNFIFTAGPAKVRTWLVNTVQLTDTASVIQKQFTQPGVYDVTLIHSNSLGCRDSFTHKSVVLPSPSGAIDPSGSRKICNGSGLRIAVDSMNITSVIWRKDTNLMNSSSGSYYFAQQEGAYHALLTNSSGCTRQTDTTTVSILSLPSSLIVPPLKDSVCAGIPAYLQSVFRYANASYNWLRNQLVIPGADSPWFNALSPGLYRLVIHDSLACADTSTVLRITVLANPVAQLTPAGKDSICNGQMMLLRADSSSSYTYVWYKDLVRLTGQNNPHFNASASGSYTVSVQDTHGCGDTSSTFTLLVKPIPTAPLTATPNPICNGDSSLLNTVSSPDYGYRWFRNDTLIPLASNSSIYTHNNGSYKVRTSLHGCDSFSSAISIVVYPLSSSPVVIRYGDTLSTGTSAGYEWYLNDTLIAGAVGQKLLISASGNYQVRITDSNGCSVTSQKMLVLRTGTRSESWLMGTLKVYPNPSGGDIFVEGVELRLIKLYDVTGRLLQKLEPPLTQTKVLLSTDLPRGFYLMTVDSEHGEFYFKIIIER